MFEFWLRVLRGLVNLSFSIESRAVNSIPTKAFLCDPQIDPEYVHCVRHFKDP